MTADFAEVLRAFRESNSLTQEELAERAGLTVKAIGALERGERRRPYPHTVRAIADALDLDEESRARLVAAVPARTRPAAAPVGGPPAVTAGGVPAPPVELVGREADLAGLAGLLVGSTTRVVTLTGPGGVGKTTLALAAARQVEGEFPGGVAMVALAGVTEAGAVLPAVAAAFGVPEAGLQSTPAGLAPYLTGRRVLLLLDNLEQLVECGPALAELSAHCPDLVVLATSQAPLRIRAEHEFRVEPLDHATTVELFRARAAALGDHLVAEPDEDAAVAELCRRLDGLPLAVELAASATSIAHPVALLARLNELLADGPRDLPERQRSMAATLDWSHSLLDEPERALLARLTVFPAGFSLAGAEAVGGPDTLRSLRKLLEHSMVSRSADVQDTERFRLLEPVREYAAAGLSDADRLAATHLLADHAVQLGRDLETDLRGAALAASLDLAEADLVMLRLAFHHLVAVGRFDDAGALVWRLWLFLALRGHGREGLTWVGSLRGQPLTDESRACWLTAASGLHFLVGEVAAQRQDGDAALGLARKLDRPDLLAEAAVMAASGALFAGDLDGASERLATVDLAATAEPAPWASLHCRIAAGQVALLAGRLDEAERLLVEAEADARALGNPFTLATTLNLRATVTELRDAHSETAALLAEAAELSVDARISWTLAYTLPALAGVAVRLGELQAGAQLFGASASYSAEHSVAASFQTAKALAERDLAAARDELGEAEFRTAWDAGRDTTGAGVVELAQTLVQALSRRARG